MDPHPMTGVLTRERRGGIETQTQRKRQVKMGQRLDLCSNWPQKAKGYHSRS